MGKFVRPLACVICKLPAGSSGVRIASLNAKKLRRWWLQVLQVQPELFDNADNSGTICQFCICDARFQSQQVSEEELDGLDWWTGRVNPLFDQFYIQNDVIRPCYVKIAAPEAPMEESPRFPEAAGIASQQTNSVSAKRRYNIFIPTDCIFCGKAFDSRRAAFHHIELTHANKTSFKCVRCYLFFKNEKERYAHWEKYHSDLRQCHYCYGLVKRSELKDHIFVSHGDAFAKNSNVCCEETISDIENLFFHMCTNRKFIRVECIFCKESVKDYQMNQHVKTFHGSDAIKCSSRKCYKYFFTAEEKEKHLVNEHGLKTGLVTCVYCQSKVRPTAMAPHVVKWHLSQAIGCSFKSRCSAYFLTKEDEQQHVLDVHMAPKEEIKSKCIYCLKYVLKRNYNVHMRNVHKYESKTCNIRNCFQYFLTDLELENHMLANHSDHAVFKCTQCTYKTCTEAKLNSHMDCAHGPENIQCQHCSKMYYSKVSYDRHVKVVHTGKMCFHCKKQVCGISNHLRLLPCRHCKAKFSCRGLLKAHLSECKQRPAPR